MNQELEFDLRRIKQNKIALAILIIGTIGSFLLFGSKKKEDVIMEEKQILREVEIVELDKNQQSIAYLEKTVEIGSVQSASVVAEYSGRVTDVNFNIGDYVHQGEVLVVFDQSDLSNSPKNSFESVQKSYDLVRKGLHDTKDSAEKSVDLAENGVDLAELQLDQAKDGGDDDAIDLAEEALKMAKDQEDQAEIVADAQVNAAKIQLEQANLQLKQAQIGFDKTFVKAPISGFIVSDKVTENDYLSAGQLVAQISKEGKLQATVYLNKEEVSRVDQAIPVDVYHGEEKISAKIKAVSNIANSDNQRFEVLIELDLEDRNLINQNMKVNIPLKIENNGGFFVPLKAVNVGQKRSEVFVVKEKKAVLVDVKLGQIVGDQVEIVEGLNVGDKLIVSGNRKVRDGEEVKILK